MIGRMGSMDTVDQRMFCITAHDFYSQLGDDLQRRAFMSTFQVVAQPGTVYEDVQNHITLKSQGSKS